MRRCSRVSSPLAALALLLLICLSHGAAAARPLPVSAALAHQWNGAKVAAEDEPPVIQEGAALGSSDELPSVAEAVEEEAEEPACEEGNDECLQRRLLHDAHVDYIYAQHKAKP